MIKKPALVALGIKKIFTHPATVIVLNGVNLTVNAGESVAIMGASGEGKTTLLNILGTLEMATEGTVEILGKPAKPSSRKNSIGFIFQNYNLLEDYTALENILMPARIMRKNTKKGSEAHSRASSLLEHVGIGQRALFHVKTLSGGERQRVAIARALCNDPPIILADEPSGNLDHLNSQAIHQLLISCCKKFNKALIVVTHDKELASMCDTVYTLQDGMLNSLLRAPER